MKRMKLFYLVLGMLLLSSCIQATVLPTPTTAPQAAPTMVLPTATSEPLIPAGWATHTSQQCEYAISYPSEMQVTEQSAYSHLLGFAVANPEEAARNFIYVSLIAPEIQNLVQQGVYNNEVYNYDPAAADVLLRMQVGESKPTQELPNGATGFTYQRLPDAIVGDHTAQAYENIQPWEFPVGTKEVRYYVSLEGCTYLIGGYMDTTGSSQPGAVTEDLFHQIVGTIQLMP